MRLHQILSALALLLLPGFAAGTGNAQTIVSLSTSSNSLLGGQSTNLTALVTGTSTKAVTWSFTPAGVGSFTAGKATFDSNSGISTNVYAAPTLISQKQTVVITATATDGSNAAASVQISLTPIVVSVSVTPATSSPSPGVPVTFTAFVQGTSQTAVTWALSAPVGSISNCGGNTCSYNPPLVFTSSQNVKLTATLNSDPNISGSATITLTPLGVSISPTSSSLTGGATQTFNATVTGGNAGVAWTISPALGAIVPNGTSATYTAPPSGAFTNGTKVTITATSIDDPTKTATATVTLTGVSISISPTTASLVTSGTQQFTATVSGTPATGVVWSISPQIGSIDQTGLYTAPSVVSGSTKVTVTATSLADATKSANATVTITSAIDVGSGAPNQTIVQEFVSAYYRNGFQGLTSLPPLGNVKNLGTTAGFYVQEFPDAAKTSGVKYALATASATTTSTPNSDGSLNNNVVQIYAPVYAYYTTIGAATAGYPLSDTLQCPSFDPSNSCQFQLFDKNYALFVYSNPVGTTGATTFFVNSGIYTEWNTLGGAGGVGRPVSATSAVTATKIAPNTAGSTATGQTFSGGVIYSITSNQARGQVHGVTEPFYDLYVAAGGPTGSLGLPISEVIVDTVTGLRTQKFEGGSLQVSSGGTGTTNLPVKVVNVTGAAAGATVTLNLGQTVTLTATPMDAQGDQLANLAISWSSSNGQVISVQPQPNSQSAVVTAVGGGTANVTAASGGVTSARLSFVVVAPCCQVGDGAPQPVQLAFQNALARNKITVQTPVSAAAARSGAGYIQMVQSNGTPPVTYLLAQSDQSGSAYVVSGGLLAAYQSLGGPTGSLGYPISDASGGGTQRFDNGALAGSPVQTVSGGILSKWALLGYETGAAGAPVAAAAAFSTFGANSGLFQNFSGGAIYWGTSGPRSGNAWFVSGLVLAAYNGDGGASGELGMPVGDEFVTAGVHQQNFEGGSITYTTGAASAQVQAAPRKPAVIVAPSAISAGARARLAISGFANGDSVKVSITGQPDFTVMVANGAYAWDYFVPLSAPSGTLTITASSAGGATAGGTLTIRGFDTNRAQLSVVRGNNQTGTPGSLLPVPIQVALLDASGAPISGAPVLFQASMGAQLSVSSALTDANGMASTAVRLPAVAGVTGVTAQSSLAQSAVTLYAQAAANSIANFPGVQESGGAALGNGTATIGQKGALLSAVAAILRYQQNRGAVPSSNGLADAPTLNQFLTTYCGADGQGNQVCDGFLSNPDSGEQIVNLWRAAQFTGGLDVAVISPTAAAIADAVAQGDPVLLSLSLSLNQAAAGGHFVVATGVAADGSIVIQDPSPLFARSNLADYLNGFSAGGGVWKGSLVGAARFAVTTPGARRFVLGALSQAPSLMNALGFDISSSSGECGLAFQMIDTVDASGNLPANGPLVSKIQACDGALASYQVSVGAAQPYHAFVTDLAAGGATFDLSAGAPATFQAARPQLNLVLAPQTANFTAAGVVNAATFTAGIAPGGIVSIFGSGLASNGAATSVDIDGEALAVLSASAFQINAVLPADVAQGTHTLRVKSPYGTASQQVTVSAVAPAIFLVGSPAVGAVENQDGSLNSPINPLSRGQVLVVYATGLGATTKHGSLSTVNTTVTAVVNGVELPVQFAGLAPGYIGLYQVNVAMPAGSAPGLGNSLTLKQGGLVSNSVMVAIQ